MPESPFDARPTETTIWSVLGTARGRQLLDLLRAVEVPVDRGTLAVALSERIENADGWQRPSPDQVRRVEIELHHHLLPKLDESGVVEYDPVGGEVVGVDVPLDEGDPLESPAVIGGLEDVDTDLGLGTKD